MVARCKKCQVLLLPPKPMCTKCFSSNLEWVELEKKGKLITYTVIHIAPKQFEEKAPYAVGIVEFSNGLRILGMICGILPEQLKVGMQLMVDFEKELPVQWPIWPRYFFRQF
jgi:uncharacterized OB-fold protein